ncbi:hypothetical protein [Actinokineospora globicatena]|uniref:Streptomyces killer toxin-like beta/gamma crystallin domain-containing protein n=1 Tax=Actinokineospora globicatena TaxID=103729 RepID=A0A9W6QU73_9PSEU|nr:hypothetical protein [Actinokineospora globicatena]GLW94885.1 hypothetical protein Aglo03_57010 [Actinokineospora globicatena]
MRKAVIAVALAAAALASATPAAADVLVIQGTCGDKFSPTVPGGAAAWTVTCAGGNVRAQGWVKDTRADVKGAEVYGTWGDGSSFGIVRAGGNGVTKTFDKGHSGSTVYLYLRVI